MKFTYIGAYKDRNSLKQATYELKKSVKYFVQSVSGRDDISTFLKRLGEYCDSIIIRRIDEGKKFLEGICTLEINEADSGAVDIILFLKFQNEKEGIEEYKYTNQTCRENFTDSAYEELLSKKTMMFEITR